MSSWFQWGRHLGRVAADEAATDEEFQRVAQLPAFGRCVLWQAPQDCEQRFGAGRQLGNQLPQWKPARQHDVLSSTLILPKSLVDVRHWGGDG